MNVNLPVVSLVEAIVGDDEVVVCITYKPRSGFFSKLAKSLLLSSCEALAHRMSVSFNVWRTEEDRE